MIKMEVRKQMKKRKIRLLSIILSLILTLSLSMTAFATGEGNSDSDESNNDYHNGAQDGNHWPGRNFCGYRVTILNKETGDVAGNSVDYITPEAKGFLSGKTVYFTTGVNDKYHYLHGSGLSLQHGDYSYTGVDNFYIMTAGSANIKSYFTRTDKQDNILSAMGNPISRTELESGKYKMLVEPMSVLVALNDTFMLTATEYAMYDANVCTIRNTWGSRPIFCDLAICTFLECDSNLNDGSDILGLKVPPSYNRTNKNNNDTIKNYLGMALVKFGATPPPPPVENDDLKLIYLSDSSSSTPIWDHTGDYSNLTTGGVNYWNYTNGITEKEFEYESKYEEYGFDHTITAIQREFYREPIPCDHEDDETIYCRFSYELLTCDNLGADGICDGHYYWDGHSYQHTNGLKSDGTPCRGYYYKSKDQRENEITISYSFDVPSPSYQQYLPLDLRVERNMTRDEFYALEPGVDIDYSGLSIGGTVENHLSTFDPNHPTHLPTLDTNTGFLFNVQLSNDQFGIPPESEGGVDILPSRSYPMIDEGNSRWLVNSVRNNGDLNRNLYFGASLYADGVTGSNLSSMRNPLGVERMDGYETYGVGNFNGGVYSFKNIKVGDYYLNANGRNWWWAEFTGIMYYDYGVHYKGKARIGSERPVFYGNLGPSMGENWENSNFWLGSEENSFLQDVLYGSFESRTVGGTQ